jgi:tetratricopeptide (TPR) repeat protein
VFASTCRNGFIDLDDADYVTRNRRVTEGLSWENTGWALTTWHASNWHPLTWLSLQLDAEIYGDRAWGFHLTNILFHTANTLLLFWSLKQMTKMDWPSAFVAAFFAVHPLHVESVAWIAERKDVLSTFFWMLALLAYAHYAAKPSWRRMLPVTAAFAAGLVAKPMLVTLPFVLLLLDYWPLGRLAIGRSLEPPISRRKAAGSKPGPAFVPARWSWILLEKAPLFLLAISSCAITFYAQQHGGAVLSQTDLPLSVRAANAALSYCAYILQIFWPVGMGLYYPHPAHEWQGQSGFEIPVVPVGLTVFFLTAVTLLAIRMYRTLPYLFVGWFWYVGTLVPVIGLVQVGSQGRADRYTYIPLIGLFIAIVWGAADLAARRGRGRQAVYAGLVLLGVSASLCWKQTTYWINSASIFRHTREACGPSSVVCANLGAVLAIQGQTEEAIENLVKAVELDANNGMAHFHLAKISSDRALSSNDFSLRENEFKKAVEHFEEAARLLPGPLTFFNLAVTYDNLGILFRSAGRMKEAERYSKAAQIRFAEAVAPLRHAVELEPGNLDFRRALGLTYRKLGLIKEAEELDRNASPVKDATRSGG